MSAIANSGHRGLNSVGGNLTGVDRDGLDGDAVEEGLIAETKRDCAMKHPVESDFDTAVTEAGVTVKFKPTNSIYDFYRLADSEDIARIGPVSPARVRHAAPSGDTEDYPSDEVRDMAQRIATEVAKSVWSGPLASSPDREFVR
jgi:hypothetical protein